MPVGRFCGVRFTGLTAFVRPFVFSRVRVRESGLKAPLVGVVSPA
jgi:hypothetical protein